MSTANGLAPSTLSKKGKGKGRKQQRQRTDSDNILSIAPKSSLPLLRSMVEWVAHPNIKYVKKAPFPDCRDSVWFLTPEYHCLESMTHILIAIAILYRGGEMEFLLSNIDEWTTPNADQISTFENLIFYILAMDGCLHLYYKTKANIKGVFWLLQPCAFNQLLLIIIFGKPLIFMNHRLIHFITTMSLGAYLAILWPDVQTCGAFEVGHFYFQHLCIICLPFFLVLRYDISISFITMCRDFAWMAIYHFVILEIFAVVSGINLNYIMSPPPGGPQKYWGKIYRTITTIGTWPMCLFSGYLIPKLVTLAYHTLIHYYPSFLPSSTTPPSLPSAPVSFFLSLILAGLFFSTLYLVHHCFLHRRFAQ